MRTRTRRSPDTFNRSSRALRGAAFCGLLLLLGGCSSSPNEISADNVAPPPAVTPDACRLVSSSALTAVLVAPVTNELVPSSPAAIPATPSPYPPPPGNYLVTSVGAHPTVGQCTYRSALGTTLVVNVFPKTTLSSMPDYTNGLHQLGFAYVSGTDDSGLIAFQDGPSVVGLALNLGGASADALARRLALLASSVTGQSLPVPSLSAGQTASNANAVPTPLPAAGEQVSGQSAAQSVQETSALAFDPTAVTVSAGGVVQWTNAGGPAHNVTFDANPELTSGTMNAGDKYELKFTRAGTYPYHCTFHPGMEGTVTVS
ncbi:MAG TPA: plastocyanin/azurin family copper-binding protein [Candidatus Dormibacteraeota bacterium]|nr:plastocyanin/azurin family copper-binding protein [Candidatus Dormibacteraeota bacterium]